MNVAVPINPSDKINTKKALSNLLPNVILDHLPESGGGKGAPIPHNLMLGMNS